MDKVTGRLFVFFEEPFWVGVFERESDYKLSVCKVTFGAEPKDYEIQEFILKNYYRLKFSAYVESEKKVNEHIKPKRLQRVLKKQVRNVGIGTKSQQALKLQQEQGKIERKTRARDNREAQKQFQFELKKRKKKEKHRGR